MSTNDYFPPLPTTNAAGAVAMQQEPQRSSGWIRPLLMAAGVLVLLGVLLQGVLGGIRWFSSASDTKTAAMQGVTALEIEATGGAFTLQYGDVDEATLDVVGSQPWTMKAVGNTLTVEPSQAVWVDFCFIICNRNGGTVTLTLPKQFESQALDADIVVTAGEFTAHGTFGLLDLEASAGRIDVSGAARTLEAEIGAGWIELDLENVQTAEFDVNAGRMNATLTGTAPKNVAIDVNAGSLELTLPPAAYQVSSNIAAGSFDNQLTATPGGAASVIEVNVSAGSVVVRDIR